jgi:hypothetical protein
MKNVERSTVKTGAAISFQVIAEIPRNGVEYLIEI